MKRIKKQILEEIAANNIQGALNMLEAKMRYDTIPYEQFLELKEKWKNIQKGIQKEKNEQWYDEEVEDFTFKLKAFVNSLIRADFLLKNRVKINPSPSLDDMADDSISPKEEELDFMDEGEDDSFEEIEMSPAIEKKADKKSFNFRGLLNRYKSLFSSSKKGKLVCSLPKVFEFNKINTVTIRIAKSKIKDAILESGLTDTKLEKAEIELGEVMVVDVFENEGEDNFEITSLNHKEQVIHLSKNEYKEWIYQVKPKRTGVYALIIRVSIVKHIKNIGTRKEDLLVWCKEIQVKVDDFTTEERATETIPIGVTLTDEALLALKSKLAKSEIGVVFQDLSNRLQFKDIALFNRLTALQTKYYHLNRDNTNGLISLDDYSTKKTQIISILLTIIDLIDNDNSELENHHYTNELERLEQVLD